MTLIFRACESHWAVFRTRPRRPWSPAIVRPDVDATYVLDVQLPVDEIDLWVKVKGLLDAERFVVH